MKKFNYSFLDDGLLPANLINITGTIYSLKTGAKIRKDEYERIFTELEKIAVVQSVKSSNAIEGIVTSDERIEEIVNQNSKPPKRIFIIILALYYLLYSKSSL